jgi:hypothetical protein
MLYLLHLVKELDVHPKHFGKNLRDVIEAKLIDEVRALACAWALCVHGPRTASMAGTEPLSPLP